MMSRTWGYAYDRPLASTGIPVVVPLATITVYEAGTVVPVTLYADADGLQPLDNPTTADASGYYYFYAVAQKIDVQISGGVVPQIVHTPYTLGDSGVPTPQVPAYAYADFPPASGPNAGALVRRTDGPRGLWMDQGTQFYSVEGEVVNVKALGAKGDGVTDDSGAILLAISLDYPVIYFPPGEYYIGDTTLEPNRGQTFLGAGIGPNLTFRSRIIYDGDGSAFKVEHPVNSSGYGMVYWEGLYIFSDGTLGASDGAGIEILAGGFAYFRVHNCRIGGNFKFGVLGDGIEVSQITENIIENGQGTADSIGIWIVNGDDRRPGQALGYSNVITITDNQINGQDYGIVDDGGSSIDIADNNLNGNGMGLWMAGRTGFTVVNNAWENAGRVTHIANYEMTDRSAIGAGAGTVDKGPCRSGLVTASVFAADIMATNSPLLFTAVTAGAYHRGIEVQCNWFRNNLGVGADINVTRLGQSFVGYNTSDRVGAHFTGVHNDVEANTLLQPSGMADSPTTGIWPTLTPFRYGQVTWAPGVVANGAAVSTTCAIAGVEVGEPVICSHDALGANDWIVSGHVQAAGVVRVVLLNVSGGPFNVPSGVSQVMVANSRYAP